MTLSPTAQSVEDFFAGGATAAKFPDGAYGTVIGGEIVEDPRMQQQRDYESNEPMFYPDGNPQMQMVIVVQAQPPDGDDDGRRALYVKGQMKAAIGEALRKIGEKAPRRGGKLWVKYIEDKPATLKNGRRGNDQKIFAAKYEPPVQAAAGQFFDDGGHASEQTSAAPATAEDMRAGSNSVGTARLPLPCPPSVPPVKWAALSLDQQQQMYDALGLARPAGRGATAASQFTDEPPF